MKWKLLILALPVLLLAGCATSFTNLSSSIQTRNSNNFYPVEVAFNSTQQSLRWDSIHPYVLVNGQLYEMHPTPLMTNRWEGFVPVPPADDSVNFRYKFDFQYYTFGSEPKPDSAYSPPYYLKIVAPPQ